MISAQRYGFFALDMQKVPMLREWKRLAILARKNEWTRDAVAIIEKQASRTIEVRGTSPLDIRGPLIEAMDGLEEAA